jgi:prefoldin alpha subunit
MTKDEELGKYMALIEQYKEQINQIELQSQYVQATILDYNKAKFTLEHLKKSKKGDEILVPIGGGSFINASLSETQKIIFDIGAGIIAEKTSDEVIVKIDERIADLQKTQERLNTIANNLQNEATEVSLKAQQLYSEEENK